MSNYPDSFDGILPDERGEEPGQAYHDYVEERDRFTAIVDDAIDAVSISLRSMDQGIYIDRKALRDVLREFVAGIEETLITPTRQYHDLHGRFDELYNCHSERTHLALAKWLDEERLENALSLALFRAQMADERRQAGAA